MYNQIILIFLINLANVYCDQLIQAQILFRHGTRNQINKNWNYDLYKDVSAYLTPVGMRQHYVLGQWLRSRYIENPDTTYNILQKQLDQNEIIIRSTDVNRTILSALSNLYGLYPPETGFLLPNNVPTGNFLPPNPESIDPQIGLNSTPYLHSPVPLHIKPEKEDYILLPFRNDACPNSAQIQNANKNSAMYLEVESRTQDLIKQYGKEMQMTDDEIAKMNLEALMQAEDTKTVYTWNGYPFPHPISPDTSQQMDDLYALQLNMVFFMNQEQANMLSTPFFQEILSNMDNKLNGTKIVKSYNFHMYSGHDTSVQLVLNSLQLTSSECLFQVWNKSEVKNKNCIYNYPAYATNIIFELWKDSQNQAYVKLLNNGTNVPPCVGSDNLSCSYEQFKNQLTSQFQDYYAGCGIQTVATETKTPKWLAITTIAMGVIFVLMLALGISFYYKYKQAVSLLAYEQQP